METENDPKLGELLKQWRVPDAPPSLDARVLGPRMSWWKFLFTGSVRVPAPVCIAVAAALLALAGALERQGIPESAPATLSLVDFRPVTDLNVRVIRNHEAN